MYVFQKRNVCAWWIHQLFVVKISSRIVAKGRRAKVQQKLFIELYTRSDPSLHIATSSILFYIIAENFVPFYDSVGEYRNCWGTYPHNRKLFISAEDCETSTFKYPKNFSAKGSGKPWRWMSLFKERLKVITQFKIKLLSWMRRWNCFCFAAPLLLSRTSRNIFPNAADVTLEMLSNLSMFRSFLRMITESGW